MKEDTQPRSTQNEGGLKMDEVRRREETIIDRENDIIDKKSAP